MSFTPVEVLRSTNADNAVSVGQFGENAHFIVAFELRAYSHDDGVPTFTRF